jgi:hypothetical protein
MKKTKSHLLFIKQSIYITELTYWGGLLGADLQETKMKCEICGKHPAMLNDVSCKKCSDRYSELLRSRWKKTRDLNSQISEIVTQRTLTVDQNVEGAGEVTQALLQPPISTEAQFEELLETQKQPSQSRLLRRQKSASTLVGYFLLGIGLLALIVSILVSSTIFAFIGLGLTFWGVLSFFVQPKNYMQSGLMSATAISSLETIDKMIVGMGYREKGVYLRTDGPEKVVVFVPSQPFSRIPSSPNLGGTFINDPEGLLLPPPGLALSSLIEKKLGFDLRDCGVEPLVQALPKVLVEDLEIARDVEIELKGNHVRFKLVDSIYADFCTDVRESNRRCGLGCPICSALACILAVATGKPVLYEEDVVSNDKKTTESCYQLLNEMRL